MRPNRIGIYPVCLNERSDGLQAVFNLTGTTQALFDAWRTGRNAVEIVPSSPAAFWDTIYSQTFHYGGRFTTDLTDTLPRISFGGFLRAPGLQDGSADPRPFYVRMVGWAHCMCNQNEYLLLEPVFGVKENSELPGQGTSSTDKENRRLDYVKALPTGRYSSHRHDSKQVHSAAIDTTFIVAESFDRFGGAGYTSETIFGVGWSAEMLGTQAADEAGFQGDAAFFMSCWIYTADLDTYDPNKS